MTASMCRRTALRAAAVVLLAAAANARDRFLHQRGKCLPESFDCYHNYEELTIAMEDIERRYPKNAFLYSVGQSVEGRHLWVLALAGWNPQQHIPIRPEVQLIGNMHGDEKHLAQTVGRELLLRLAHHILTSYESNSDEAVMRVMNTTRVHIMPSMNPDGFERTALGICQMDDDRIARENSHGIDLNRNFPDRWGPKVRSDPLEPETEAVVKWSARLPFTLAANFHGGVVVVNYPYDSAPLPARSDSAEELLSTIDKDGRSVTPDDLEFKQIATDYAQSSQEAAAAVGTYELDKDACYPGDRFANGITNGAQWYTVYGSMQDFLYRERGVFAITVELSCCKAPGANQLELFWRANKHALIQFPLWANTGVIGSVNDNKGPISKATLYVKGRESVPFHVDKHGYFRRVLLPRNEPYILHVDAPGYQPQFVEFAVHPGRHHSPATLKIHLEPLTTTAAPAQEKTTRTTQKASESESTDYYYYPELFETDATTRAHPTSPSTFIQTIKATLEVLVQTEVHTEPTMSTGLLEATTTQIPDVTTKAAGGLSPAWISCCVSTIYFLLQLLSLQNFF